MYEIMRYEKNNNNNKITIWHINFIDKEEILLWCVKICKIIGS